MIHIDASQGEGGGQVLRSSLAMSIITTRPIDLTGIRAGRRNPGLAPQHLAGVRAAAHICGAEVEGDALGSQELIFRPAGPARPGDYTFDIQALAGQGSAGALTLLLQTLLLPLALADGPSRLTLRGGTHAAWSPPVHYVFWVLLPMLRRIGVSAAIELSTYGLYPKGGGEARVTIDGSADLRGAMLTDRGEFVGLEGLAVASNLPSHIPQRISGRANNLLREAGLPPRVEPLRVSGPSEGAGVFIALAYEHVMAGFTGLGRPGKPSDEVAEEAVQPLIQYHRQTAALDPHLPDQLLPALMLAAGPSLLSTVEITRHTLTNITIVQHFVERRVDVQGLEGQPGFIRVEGMGPGLPPLGADAV